MKYSKEMLIFCMFQALIFFAFTSAEKVVASHRIITLTPSLTEIVWDILPEKDKASLVGVSSFSDFPGEITEIPRVGSYISPKIEKIASLNPTIILASKRGNPKETVNKLKNMGYTVKVFHIQTIDNLIQTYKIIGKDIDQEKRANIITQNFKKEVNIIQNLSKEINPKIKVYYQLGQKPAHSINSDTITSHLIDIAGGVNIFSKNPIRYPKPKTEAVLKRNPEVILISEMTGNSAVISEIVSFWKNLATDKHFYKDHIHQVDSSIMDRVGPRSIQALKVIHEKIMKAHKFRNGKMNHPMDNS